MQKAHFPEALLSGDAQNGDNTERERRQETGLTRAALDALLSAGLISRNPCIVSGAFVFTGTRVPIYNLWDYLSAGDSLDDFLESFPTVPVSLAEKAIILAEGRLMKGVARP